MKTALYRRYNSFRAVIDDFLMIIPNKVWSVVILRYFIWIFNRPVKLSEYLRPLW
jgi:hypothetical protein